MLIAITATWKLDWSAVFSAQPHLEKGPSCTNPQPPQRLSTDATVDASKQF